MRDDKRFKIANAEAIERLRTDRGWSQPRLAEKACYSTPGKHLNVSLASIKRAEDKVQPRLMQLRTLEAIATALRVPTRELYFENAGEAMNEGRRYTWLDVRTGAQTVADSLYADGKRQFDAVVTFPGASAIFCGYVMRLLPLEVSMRVPVYTGIFVDAATDISARQKYYHVVSCNLFNLLIPRELVEGVSKRIVVIDDCILTGRVMDKLKEFFTKFHTLQEVQFACCICFHARGLVEWQTPDIIGLPGMETRMRFPMPWGDSYCFEDAFTRPRSQRRPRGD